jgi:ATPase family associated with various cellular activities (AAA)
MNSSDKFVEELQELARAGYPLVAVQTYEETRALALLRDVTKMLTRFEQESDGGLSELPPPWKFITYSPTMGLIEVNGGPKPIVFNVASEPDPLAALMGGAKKSAGADTRKLPIAMAYIGQADRTIFALCDINPLLKDPMAVRVIRETAWAIDGKDVRVNADGRQVMVVLVGPVAPDDDTLAKEMKVVDLKLPSEDEMMELVAGKATEAEAQGIEVEMPQEAIFTVAHALLGLSFTEAINLLAKAIVHNGELTAECANEINTEKAALIRNIEGLTYKEPGPADGMGGNSEAVRCIDQAAKTTTAKAAAFGLAQSKGILEVGFPGCGKTYSAEISSGRMKRGLFEMSWGELTGAGGGIVGQGEKALRRGLEMCDLLHPILLIDEAEKMWSGMESSGKSDGGMQSRMIGQFMSWQSKQKGTFVIATCNSIDQLNPAQVQVGRWSYVLFFDLPSVGERKSIFDIHIRRRNGRDPEKFDTAKLARMSEGFSGREIEQAVERGLLIAFEEAEGDREVTQEDFEEAVTSIKPTSAADPDNALKLRTWAQRASATRANDPEVEQPIVESARKTRPMMVRKG